MARRGNAVVLASGGLDSAALVGWALARYAQVHPVYCQFGLRWEKAERHWLKKFLRAIQQSRLRPLVLLKMSTELLYANHWSLTGKNVPGYRSQDPSVYLPGRNALLLSQAAVYAVKHRCTDILVGTLGGNPFPDATPLFFKTLERALILALGKSIHIRTPFRRSTKTAVLRSSLNLPLHLAFSCLNPAGLHPCRACNKCAERDRVLKSYRGPKTESPSRRLCSLSRSRPFAELRAPGAPGALMRERVGVGWREVGGYQRAVTKKFDTISHHEQK